MWTEQSIPAIHPRRHSQPTAVRSRSVQLSSDRYRVAILRKLHTDPALRLRNVRARSSRTGLSHLARGQLPGRRSGLRLEAPLSRGCRHRGAWRGRPTVETRQPIPGTIRHSTDYPVCPLCRVRRAHDELQPRPSRAYALFHRRPCERSQRKSPPSCRTRLGQGRRDGTLFMPQGQIF